MPEDQEISHAEQQQLFQQAVLGKQVEDFFASDVGRYVIAHAAREREEALEALAGCDPESPATIRALQMKIQVSGKIGSWLEEAILRGLQAVNIIDDRGE